MNTIPFSVLSALGARFFQYPVGGDVLAGATAQFSKTIQSGFHFWSERLSVSYTTNQNGVDDGVCRLSVRFQSGANQQSLTSDFISLETISSPGRQRTTAIAGDPSLGLQIPGIPFPYLWEASGAIFAETKSAATVSTQTVRYVFHGYLIPRDRAQDVDSFYRMIQPGVFMPNGPGHAPSQQL